MFANNLGNTLFTYSQKLHTISKSLMVTTEDLTPVNFESEKEKFFKLQNYNPQFIYRSDKKLHLVEKKLIELKKIKPKMIEQKEINTLIDEFLTELDMRLATKKSIGSIDFPDRAGGLYAWDLMPLSELEKNLPPVNFNEKKKVKLHDAYEMQIIFTKYLSELGLSGVRVEVDTFNDHMIRVGDKHLRIGAAIKRNDNNLKRLLVHEIESHILQRHNIKKANNPLIFLQKISEWLLYSEGMAVFNEVKSNTITMSSYLDYKLRYKAVLMRNKPFYQIYNEMIKYVPEKKAFLTTYRIKRGMGDTALPGGYPKDAAYLFGFYKVNEYLQNGGSYKLLYKCRIPRLGEILQKYALLPEREILLPKS
jgi:hypothetical protein